MLNDDVRSQNEFDELSTAVTSILKIAFQKLEYNQRLLEGINIANNSTIHRLEANKELLEQIRHSSQDICKEIVLNKDILEKICNTSLQLMEGVNYSYEYKRLQIFCLEEEWTYNEVVKTYKESSRRHDYYDDYAGFIEKYKTNNALYSSNFHEVNSLDLPIYELEWDYPNLRDDQDEYKCYKIYSAKTYQIVIFENGRNVQLAKNYTRQDTSFKEILVELLTKYGQNGWELMTQIDQCIETRGYSYVCDFIVTVDEHLNFDKVENININKNINYEDEDIEDINFNRIQRKYKYYQALKSDFLWSRYYKPVCPSFQNINVRNQGFLKLETVNRIKFEGILKRKTINRNTNNLEMYQESDSLNSGSIMFEDDWEEEI